MPKKTTRTNKLGAWAFLIGVIIAIIFGFFIQQLWVLWTLVIIGIIIGFMNVTVTEVQPFLLAGTVLVIISALSGALFNNLTVAGIPFIANILNNFLAIFVPATVIVALKSLFAVARD